MRRRSSKWIALISIILCFHFFVGIFPLVKNNLSRHNISDATEIINNSGVICTHPPDLDLTPSDPANHTISWMFPANGPFDYFGAYSFMTVPDGSLPTGWRLWIPSGSSFNVIEEEDGHTKVVKMTSINIYYGTRFSRDFSPRENGTIEFWFKMEDVSELFCFCFEEVIIGISTLEEVIFGISTNTAGWISNLYDNWTDIVQLADDTWYHFRITFECGNGGYDNLNADTLNLYVNGMKYGPYNFTPKAFVDIFDFSSYPEPGGSTAYIDSVDFSWELDYYTNRNMDYLGSPPLTYAVFENGTQRTNWQPAIGQVNYNVSGLQLGNGVHNISLCFNDSHGVWYKDDVLVRVSPSLNYPILYPISPNPNFNGLIDLDWNNVEGATIYFIYRDISPLATVDGVTPMATTSETYYQDRLYSSGTYYYVILASNSSWNSSISNCESVVVALPHPVFDGLYITYSCSSVIYGNALWNASYSHVSGTIFHVSGIHNGSYYWDIDVQTRTMLNSSFFSSGARTPLWIFPNLTLGDAVLMDVTTAGPEHIFDVVDKFFYNLSNYGPVEVWRLDDRGKSGCYALYETSTGLLIKSIFHEYGMAGGMLNIYLDLLVTNAELNRTVPSAPRNLYAIPGNQQINLTWQVPSKEGNSSITNYKIYRGTSPGTESLLTTIGNELTYTDTNLTNGQIYYYRISAINADGEGDLSEEVSATPATVPNTPQNLLITVINGNIVISWQAPSSNGGSPIIGYNIYRGTSSGNQTYLVTTSNISSFTDTNLINGQVYFYRISAVNTIGESPLSDEVIAMVYISGKGEQEISLIIILLLVAGLIGVSGYAIHFKRKIKRIEGKIMGLSKTLIGEKASKSWKLLSTDSFEVEDQVKQLPILKEAKKITHKEFHRIENEDRLDLFKSISSNLSESEAENLWISLMLRFNRMCKLEKWEQALITLGELSKLAEFLGNYDKFNDLSVKYDEIKKKQQIIIY